MPGTASSQIQSRSTSKARPSANVRAANLLANTPVLFRLPAIPNATAQDLAASISANIASLPTATLSAVALSNAQATAAQAEVASEAMVDSQDSLQRTWWEHWSSGIVLIVLLIALATASIFAWQGSGKSNSKLMADTKQENESSSDLSNIEVPKLTNPKLEIPVSTKLNSAAEKLEASSFQNSTTLQKSADDLDTSLILSEALSGNPNASATNQNSTLATSTPAALPAPYATASLQQPVVKPQEPLFKDDGLVPAKPNISAQPASTATQLNSTQSADPSVWDSSKTSSQQAAKPLTLELSDTGSSGAATSSLAQATERSNNTSNRVSATLTSQSVTIASPTDPSLVPTNMQFAAKTATPELDQAALFASYRQYATTDMSAPAESPGNRYKTAANVGSQAQVAGAATGTAATTVGYTQQPTQQQPTQQQPIQQQPRTQAIIQPSPGSYNYTLQPTQNFAPNAGSQSQ